MVDCLKTAAIVLVMQFSSPLIEGKLIKRYKRFLADVELENGEVITAHCANSGSMLSVKEPGSKVWLSPANNPKRKLQYTWELIEVNDNLVGINTSHPNHLVKEAIENGTIQELRGYDHIKPEVKYGKNSRIDLLLSADGKPDCYVEVKNVTLKRKTIDEFPDAVTARGTKHLNELVEIAKGGQRAVMLFCIQRSRCKAFQVASDIDPAYAKAFQQALDSGVEAYAYECDLSVQEIKITRPVPINRAA